MNVSQRFVKTIIHYINDVKRQLDYLADETFDMDRGDSLRNMSLQLYQIVIALERLN